MTIQYISPLSRAFERMKTILFKPFDLGKWFALGFTAFLAGLMNSGGGGGGNLNLNGGDFDWDNLYMLPGRAMEWFSENPFWMMAITAGLFIVLVLFVVLTWLSSRGMFMFLDNVVHNRSFIARPWGEFKTLGDSLFLWRLVFGIVSLSIFLGFIIIAFLIAYNIHFIGGYLLSHFAFIAGIALIGLLLFIIVFYIWIFLKDFVVPIMYKNGITVNNAWRIFLELFRKHAGHFILYGLFIIALYILVATGVIICGLMTCCCGFILLSIPYIGSVLLLPVSVSFRALGLEFLEQFGAEHKILPPISDEAGTINPVL